MIVRRQSSRQLKEVGWKFWINLKGWEWKRPKSRQEAICVSPLAVIFSGSIVILGKNLGQVLVYILGENFGQVLMYNYRHYFRQKPWTSFNVYFRQKPWTSFNGQFRATATSLSGPHFSKTFNIC